MKEERDVLGELMSMAVELGTTAERLDQYCEQLKELEKRTSDLLALIAENKLEPETGKFFDTGEPTSSYVNQDPDLKSKH
tara:strand:+ start:825 stop:1064 length:240 start_codon:yes stop_codon:yes gene_type:complete